MIPKIIHYCWFGKKPIPLSLRKCINTWEKFCPDYEIIRWDEKNFDIEKSLFTKNAYAAKAWAFVSDFARLKIIYDSGGVYLDTDVELLKNLDPLLKYDFFIGVQQFDNLINTGLGFGAIQNNTLVKKMIEKYDSLAFSKEKMKILACPYFNNEAIVDSGYIYNDEPVHIGNSIILPPKYMDPISPGNTKNLLCQDSISIHHYNASWGSNSTRLRRSIISFIGPKKIDYLKKIIKKVKNDCK